MFLRPAAAIVREPRASSGSIARRSIASSAAPRRRQVAKDSSAVASLIELMAQRPIDRYSDDDMMFAMPAKAPPPKGKVARLLTREPKPKLEPRPKVDDTLALTHRITRYD